MANGDSSTPLLDDDSMHPKNSSGHNLATGTDTPEPVVENNRKSVRFTLNAETLNVNEQSEEGNETDLLYTKRNYDSMGRTESPLNGSLDFEQDNTMTRRMRLENPMTKSFVAYTAKPPHSKYDDFHTVDWIRDSVRDLYRFIDIGNKENTLMGRVYKVWDAGSAWFLILMLGIASGFAAGIVDIGADWFLSLKLGFCLLDPTMDISACCWSSNQTEFFVEKCTNFYYWSDILNTDNAAGIYLFNYFMFVIYQYIFLAIVFGFLSAIFVKTLAPYATGSGIPEVKTILSGYVIHGYLGKLTLLVKSMGMMLAVGAGLSLGKEGPLVHVACCCGNIFSNLFPKYKGNEAKKREILSAAAAAGVSVAFGAPVGGVLFSLEEVSYYFPLKTLWRAFFAALIAAGTLQYINPYPNGNLVLFYANYSDNWHLFELLPFAFIGLLGGIYGALFIKLNILWSRVRKFTILNKFPVTEVVIVTFLTALFAFPNPYTKRGAAEVIRELFRSCAPEDTNDLCNYNLTSAFLVEGQYHDTKALSRVYSAMWMLLLAMLLKLITTIFTFGMKIPAGLFIPSLFAGACVGRVIGICVEQAVFYNNESSFVQFFCPGSTTCVVPGLYAMVGAASFLGGVTRMTVSLVVIMFELTGGLSYIIPIMIAAMVSKWVADAFGVGGIYDEHIKLNRFPFMETKDRYTFDAMVTDVMSPKANQPPLAVVSATESRVCELEELLDTYDFWGFPVVLTMESQMYVGYVTHQELHEALMSAYSACSDLDAETPVKFLPPTDELVRSSKYLNFFSLLDTSQFQVSIMSHMYNVVEMFRKMGLRQAIITHNGKVAGIITKKDIVKHLEDVEHYHHSKSINNIKFVSSKVFPCCK